jgi:hypothetical protein
MVLALRDADAFVILANARSQPLARQAIVPIALFPGCPAAINQKRHASRRHDLVLGEHLSAVFTILQMNLKLR